MYTLPPNDLPMAELQAKDKPEWGKVVGGIGADQFIGDLVSHNAYPFPLVFDKAKEVVRGRGHDLVKCLQLGLVELKLRWAPKINL